MGVQPVGYGVLQAAWILISMILQISNGQGKIWNLFFLAACYQLSGDKNRGKYANAMIGNKAVRVICGYHEKAPGAGTNKDGAVAEAIGGKTGENI